MQATKILTPLVLSLALFGCNKAEQPAQTTVQPAPAPTAPASNTATATATTATATASNMTAEQHIDAREDIMESWGKARKSLSGMVENPSSFNAEQAKTLAQEFNKDPWSHFPEGSKGGDAQDAVWTDNAKFQQQIEKFKTAVKALNDATATATNADAIKAQVGEIGANCKGCHETFKKD